MSFYYHKLPGVLTQPRRFKFEITEAEWHEYATAHVSNELVMHKLTNETVECIVESMHCSYYFKLTVTLKEVILLEK